MKSYRRNLDESHVAFENRVEREEKGNVARLPRLPKGTPANSISRYAMRIIFSATPLVRKRGEIDLYDRIWEETEFMWSHHEIGINHRSPHSPGATDNARWRKSTEQEISIEEKRGNLIYLDKNGNPTKERKEIVSYSWVGPISALYPRGCDRELDRLPPTQVYIIVNKREYADLSNSTPESKVGKSSNAEQRLRALRESFAPEGGEMLRVWQFGLDASTHEATLKNMIIGEGYRSRTPSREYFRPPRDFLAALTACNEEEILSVLREENVETR